MLITPEKLASIILEVREGLVASGDYDSFEAINAGYCSDFADDIYERLGQCAHESLSQLGIDNFMQLAEDDEFNDGYPLDRDLLMEHWPAVEPTQGLTWDDLDQLSADAGFGSGTHIWIELHGRFYDAETPDGVDNFFELPFFQRVISSWIEDKNISVAASQ